MKSVIQDKIHSVPFVLRRWLGSEDSAQIQITEPLSASFLMDDLTVVHDSFSPSESKSMVSRGIDRLFGDITKGYHETEKMLLTNTLMLGIGEITAVDGKLKLSPPQSGAKYVLTKRSKYEIIKSLESKTFWIKVLVIGTGVIGASLLCHIIYKMLKKHWQEQRRRGFVREARDLRAQAQRRLDEGNSDEENVCIICLSNPREIVLLNCGHLCLCADCVTELPEPLLCPVCRQPVERYVTTYRP